MNWLWVAQLGSATHNCCEITKWHNYARGTTTAKQQQEREREREREKNSRNYQTSRVRVGHSELRNRRAETLAIRAAVLLCDVIVMRPHC